MNAELEARTRWTLARIGEAINAGRDAGWLQGPILDVGDSDSCLDAIASDVDTPMRQLASRLALDATELDLLWLLACIELEPRLAHAAQALVFPGVQDLSVQIVERMVARCGHLEPEVFERLHHKALIDTTFDSRVPHYRRLVRVHDRVLELARGVLSLDRSMRAVAILETAFEVRGRAQVTTEIPAALRSLVASADARIAVADGAEGSGRRTMLRRAIADGGRSVLAIRTCELSTEARLVAQLRAIARECRLHGASPLFIEIDQRDDVRSAIECEPGTFGCTIFATARHNPQWSTSVPVSCFQIPRVSAVERHAIWQRGLQGADQAVVDECATRYDVTPGVAARAVASAIEVAGSRDRVAAVHVHEALRAQLARRLAGLASRTSTTQSWDDLVLPVEQIDVLVELVSRVRCRTQVLEQWGFAAKVGRGLGTAALFSGPPGTGKTMIAGLVAKELGLDLYQIDLSKIVSKYIGETEKQLSHVFDAAESGHAILLFDEADSLFAKRTEVKSSNDRYANLEVNYLLQRMEQFAGITILTTNHETAIDQAFMRRLAFHIRVPMPEEHERQLIWRAMIPASAPVAADLDLRDLSRRFVMSGGYIRNAALRAAFMAAEAGTAITTPQLERAARLEYEAMGKIAA